MIGAPPGMLKMMVSESLKAFAQSIAQRSVPTVLSSAVLVTDSVAGTHRSSRASTRGLNGLAAGNFSGRAARFPESQVVHRRSNVRCVVASFPEEEPERAEMGRPKHAIW